MMPQSQDRTVVLPVGSPIAAPESPSLFAADSEGPPAFELKFLLTEQQARAAAECVRHRLALDPHADPALGDAYLTTSLYTDTPAYDVLRRTSAVDKSKYRVRRYGAAGPVFVEQKVKSGDRVRKRRSPLPPSGSAVLGDHTPPDGWAGSWFRHAVAERQLRPVCRIAYERVAYRGTADGGVVRLTFDRYVRGCFTTGWEVGPVGPAPALLDGRVICEFKFRVALPALFKGIVHDLGLTPSPVSKYRSFMRAAGVIGADGAADPEAAGVGTPGQGESIDADGLRSEFRATTEDGR